MKLPFVLFLVIYSLSSHAVDILEDDFEGSGLNSIWRTDRFAPGRVELQSLITRSGHQALKMTLNKGDMYEAGDEESLPSERTEIGELQKLEALEGHTYEYSFSQFVPADIPIANVRLNLAQWKERCLFKKCDPENALIAVQYVNGELRVKRQHTKKSEVIYRSTEDIRNQWLDYKFTIKFSKGSEGFIKAFLNGTQIIDYKGITAWPLGSSGYRESGNTFYFKMGLYRDEMEAPMSIYVDDYKRVLIE